MFGHYYYGENFYGSRYYGGPEQLGARPSNLTMTVSVGQVTIEGAGLRVIGTPERTTGSNANSGTVSSTITVPVGTTAIVVCVTGYTGTANGLESMTFTKGGVDTAMVRVPGGDISTLYIGGAMFYMIEPDVGVNKSLKWDWIGSSTSVDGAFLYSWIFLGGTALSDPLRGTNFVQSGDFPLVAGVVPAASQDLIVAYCAFAFGGGAVTSWQNLTTLAQLVDNSGNDGAWATSTGLSSPIVGALAAGVDPQGSLIAIAFREPSSIWAEVTGNTMGTAVGDVSFDNTAGIPAYATSPAMVSSVGQVTLAGNIWVDVVQTGSFGQQGASGNANTGTVSSTISVPADAELILVGISGAFSALPNCYEAMTFTKGGVDTAMIKCASGDVDPTKWRGAMFYQLYPDTGTNKVLKWDWIGSDSSAVAAGMNVTWSFWKGIEPGRPVRYGTAVQVNGMAVSTGMLDIRENANDTVVALASFLYDPGNGGGSIDEWAGVTELAEVTNTSYAENTWAAAVPALTARAVEVVSGTGSGIALMAVVLRSISAAGEVIVDEGLTLPLSLGTVTVNAIDNRQDDAFDPTTTSPPLGVLSGDDKYILTSVPGATNYIARSTTHHGGTRTAGEDCYGEVTIGGGTPTGYVGVYNEDENSGALVELQTGDIIEYPSETRWHSVFAPLVDGDVIGMAYKGDSGRLWFRVNGGFWNGDPAATPEGWDWPNERTTGHYGPLSLVPDEVSSGPGWRWREDNIVMVEDANATLENLQFFCPVVTREQAHFLTVRNCLFELNHLDPAQFVMLSLLGDDNLIEYCTFNGAGGADGVGEEWSGNNMKALVTEGERTWMRYNHFRGTGDCFSISGHDCIIEYNYAHDQTTGVEHPTDDPHTDCIQMYSYRSDRCIIRHNNIDGFTRNNDLNTPLIMGESLDFLLDHNRITKGGYCAFLAWYTGSTVSNNRFGRGVAGYVTINSASFHPNPGGPVFTGNVDDDSGLPILPPFGFTIPTTTSVSVPLSTNSVAASVGSVTVDADAVSSWPDATNTGTTGVLTAVPGSATSGTGWTWNGTDKLVETTSASVTISNLDVSGGIYILHSGVTISNCRATYVSGVTFGIFNSGAFAGVTVTDCEVAGPGGALAEGYTGVRNDGGVDFIVRRCDISGAENGVFHGGLDGLIEDNYIHDLAPENANDKITNGAFAADTNWTKSGTTIAGGKGVFSSAASNSTLTQSVSVTAAVDYTVVYTVSGYSGGTITPQLTGGSTVSGTARTANGSYSDTLTAASGNTAFRLICTGTTTLNVDDVTMFADGPHTDGIQLVGGNECDGTTVQHNAVHSVHTFATSALIMGQNDHVTVTDNKLRGGYAVLYVYKDSTNVYTDNRIGDQSEVTGGALVSDTGGAGTPTWTGNVNDDTEAVIPAP